MGYLFCKSLSLSSVGAAGIFESNGTPHRLETVRPTPDLVQPTIRWALQVPPPCRRDARRSLSVSFVGPFPPAAVVLPLVRVGPVLPAVPPAPATSALTRRPGPAGRPPLEYERHVIPHIGLALQQSGITPGWGPCLVTQPKNIPCGVKLLSSAQATETDAEAGIRR